MWSSSAVVNKRGDWKREGRREWQYRGGEREKQCQTTWPSVYDFNMTACRMWFACHRCVGNFSALSCLCICIFICENSWIGLCQESFWIFIKSLRKQHWCMCSRCLTATLLLPACAVVLSSERGGQGLNSGLHVVTELLMCLWVKQGEGGIEGKIVELW